MKDKQSSQQALDNLEQAKTLLEGTINLLKKEDIAKVQDMHAKEKAAELQQPKQSEQTHEMQMNEQSPIRTAQQSQSQQPEKTQPTTEDVAPKPDDQTKETSENNPEEVEEKVSVSDLPEEERIGTFNGEFVILPNGKKYQVPPNYVSKSKLVEGDKLLLVKEGDFNEFRVIELIDRIEGSGILTKKENQWVALFENKEYRVVAAAIRFFNGEIGDVIKIQLPATYKETNPTWAAVDSVEKSAENAAYEALEARKRGEIPGELTEKTTPPQTEQEMPPKQIPVQKRASSSQRQSVVQPEPVKQPVQSQPKQSQPASSVQTPPPTQTTTPAAQPQQNLTPQPQTSPPADQHMTLPEQTKAAPQNLQGDIPIPTPEDQSAASETDVAASLTEENILLDDIPDLR